MFGGLSIEICYENADNRCIQSKHSKLEIFKQKNMQSNRPSYN